MNELLKSIDEQERGVDAILVAVERLLDRLAERLAEGEINVDNYRIQTEIVLRFYAATLAIFPKT